MDAAIVVISLDFELRWGVADSLGSDFSTYRRNLEGVRDVVPAALELFRQHDVRATWAVVGATACADWDEYEVLAPEAPRYLEQKLQFDRVMCRKGDPQGRLHFAPELVRMIADAPGQELGSHTFSHIYLGEPGVMRRDVAADAGAVSALFQNRYGQRPTSFVFPRNQVAFTEVLAQCGIRRFRENPQVWFWNCTREVSDTLLCRGLRLVDAIAPLGRRAYRCAGKVHRASYFLRFNLPEAAFTMHRRRLKREAADLRNGDVLHLWFHSHNLGGAPDRCLRRLASVIDAIACANPSIRFLSMREADLQGRSSCRDVIPGV